MVGEPASTFWGNRSAGPGGTARPHFLNAYLIKKVRTPSGKPGWGKTEKPEIQETLHKNWSGINVFGILVGGNGEKEI